MSTVFESRLAEFVDRSAEMRLFMEILDVGDPPVMVVTGGGGLGKSSLLARMIHECALRDLRRSEIVWTETRNHDYLDIMRRVRDDLGPRPFNVFTDLVNYYTVPQYRLVVAVEGNVRVAEGAEFVDTSTGDIAGVIIKDSMISIPRSDLAVPEDEKRERLTDAFIAAFADVLRAQPREKPIVLFLDATEKMTSETRKWVWGELLQAMSDGRLVNLRVVLCGREGLPDDLSLELRRIVEEAPLRPLELEHVEEYLEKRGIDAANRPALALMLMASSEGNPLKIASNVDAFLKLQRRQQRDRG